MYAFCLKPFAYSFSLKPFAYSLSPSNPFVYIVVAEAGHAHTRHLQQMAWQRCRWKKRCTKQSIGSSSSEEAVIALKYRPVASVEFSSSDPVVTCSLYTQVLHLLRNGK